MKIPFDSSSEPIKRLNSCYWFVGTTVKLCRHNWKREAVKGSRLRRVEDEVTDETLLLVDMIVCTVFEPPEHFSKG